MGGGVVSMGVHPFMLGGTNRTDHLPVGLFWVICRLKTLLPEEPFTPCTRPLGLMRRQCGLINTSPWTLMTRSGLNVLGGELVPCSYDPLTGFFRDGCCNTNEEDTGTHVICAKVTQAFLNYSRDRGNDLMTPQPAHRFAGLKAGDRWCLCALRWLEAFQAGVAPPVVLESTHQAALHYVTLEQLREFAWVPH